MFILGNIFFKVELPFNTAILDMIYNATTSNNKTILQPCSMQHGLRALKRAINDARRLGQPAVFSV